MCSLFHVSTVFPLKFCSWDGILQIAASELTGTSSPQFRRHGRFTEGKRRKEGEWFHCSLSQDSSGPVLHIELRGPESLPGHRDSRVTFRFKVKRALSSCF